MGGTVLNTTLKEKDLGLTISADMKVSEQCGIAAAKGNQILVTKSAYKCGLTTLERLRGYQIEVLKIYQMRMKNVDRNICSRLRKREGVEGMELH